MIQALPGEVAAALATLRSKTSIGTAPPEPSSTNGSETFNDSTSRLCTGCSPVGSLAICTPVQGSTTAGATASVSEQASELPTELTASTR